MKVVPNDLVLFVEVTPKTALDRERMEQGLKTLAIEDSTFVVSREGPTGPFVLKGLTELHLDQLVDRLLNTFSVKADIGAPSVAYRRIKGELFEPIMHVTITTPDTYDERIKRDLRSRRGAILSVDTKGASMEIASHVPMPNMFGYPNSLLSMTNGLARFTMAFDHYAKVPSNGPDDDPPSEIGKRA